MCNKSRFVTKYQWNGKEINFMVMNKTLFDFILDINECETGVHGCSQMCINVDGGFNCACYYGFTLLDDRETCEKGWFVTKNA